MNRATLLVALMAIAPACGPSAPPPPAPTASTALKSTRGSKPNRASRPVEPTTSQPLEPAAPEPSTDASTHDTSSPPTELKERYTLEKEAPQGIAWVTIRNTYLTDQYVFVDGELFGWVPPGQAGRFEVAPGPHNVTLSDSRDGSANAQVLAEVFDSGYSYYYDVVVR